MVRHRDWPQNCQGTGQPHTTRTTQSPLGLAQGVGVPARRFHSHCRRPAVEASSVDHSPGFSCPSIPGPDKGLLIDLGAFTTLSLVPFTQVILENHFVERTSSVFRPL